VNPSRIVLRVAHDASLAMWFGGALMGAIGLNKATIEVDEHTQRTRVANAGWFAWAPFAGAALTVHVLSAYLRGRVAPSLAPSRDTRLVRTRTVITAAAALATAETGVSGSRVVRAGDVPVATAVQPISDTPAEVARAQHRLRRGQWAVPALTAAVLVLEATQSER
jgi:hypothetical protein